MNIICKIEEKSIAPAVYQHPEAWLILTWRMNKMENKQEVIKAFRAARIDNEKLLMEGKIRYCDYAEIMLGFESELRELGVVF